MIFSEFSVLLADYNLRSTIWWELDILQCPPINWKVHVVAQEFGVWALLQLLILSKTERTLFSQTLCVMFAVRKNCLCKLKGMECQVQLSVCVLVWYLKNERLIVWRVYMDITIIVVTRQTNWLDDGIHPNRDKITARANVWNSLSSVALSCLSYRTRF